MTDVQFYTFVGLGVVGLWLLYTAVHTLAIVCRRVDAVNHSVGVLQIVIERGNTDMQSRVYDAAAAANRASGLLGELVQPIRDQKRWQERAKYGLGPE